MSEYNKLGKAIDAIEAARKAAEDGITLEPCGCKSTIGNSPDGTPGRSVVPCKGHAFKQIAGHMQQVTNMFAHIGEIELKSG